MYLLDKEFLRQLDLQQYKEIYAKIILLTFDEQPIKEINGRITSGGSVNIDGSSAVRRSCSLTMVADSTDTSDVDWVLRNKFKLEVGVKNTINSNYPEIIWFKQGMYVFTSISTSVSVNNFTISLQAKDKMCLINGELGGSLTSSTDFGKIEEEKVLETGEIMVETNRLKIKDIIINMMHVFANEPYQNIILNDMDDNGLELLEWRGDTNMYMTIDKTTGEMAQTYLSFQKDWGSEDKFVFYSLSSLLSNQDKNISSVENDKYYVARVQYGDTAGYRVTDLTYPGDLIGNAGEAITSVLDKIKNTFSDFECFYDIDGRFIVQKKRTYINTAGNGIVNTDDGESYIQATMQNSTVSYSFEDNMIITAISSQPNITNIKNDYSVFGNRNASGVEVPIHLRTAIDIKPSRYTSYNDISYNIITDKLDWREIIYQMAKDYYTNNLKEDYYSEIYKNNKTNGYYEGQETIPFGKTGYEQYYIDLQGFWRQLYHPGVFDTSFITDSEKKKIARELLIDEGISSTEITDEMINSKIKGLSDYNYKNYLQKEYNEDGWNKNIKEAPENLNFWFDFLDSESDLGRYQVNQIGRREKVSNNSKIKAIAYKDTPNAVFVSSINETVPTGYVKIQTPEQTINFFSISSKGSTAFDEFYNLLYNHAVKNEQITITALPIYYLEPNVRIHVYDEKTKINGDYIVSRITVPLQHNGTTSITATKIVDRIY